MEKREGGRRRRRGVTLPEVDEIVRRADGVVNTRAQAKINIESQARKSTASRVKINMLVRVKINIPSHARINIESQAKKHTVSQVEINTLVKVKINILNQRDTESLAEISTVSREANVAILVVIAIAVRSDIAVQAASDIRKSLIALIGALRKCLRRNPRGVMITSRTTPLRGKEVAIPFHPCRKKRKSHASGLPDPPVIVAVASIGDRVQKL